MTPRIPLPDEFRNRSFDRAAARRAGLSGGRLRRRDVRRPWYGVYATHAAGTVRERCLDYAVRLKPGQFFSHGTAALLHAIPVPRDVEEDEVLHIGAVRPADAPHAKGVVGHRLTLSPRLVELDGLPVVDEAEVFCQLGAMLGLEDLVVVADHLLNITGIDEALARERLLERIALIRRPGGSTLVRAARLARRGSRSPAETRIRLTLEAGGVPRAELNAPIVDGRGRYLGSPDFVWRDRRVVLEYEGDGHREQEQFRYDILRYEDLADAGWRVLRATALDLTAEGRRRLVRRVSAALE